MRLKFKKGDMRGMRRRIRMEFLRRGVGREGKEK